MLSPGCRLLVCISLFTSAAFSTLIEDVNLLNSALTTLADPGFDSLAQLRRISSQSAALMELIHPIGGLIGTALEIGLKPDQTEELRAYHQLQKDNERNFKQVGQWIQATESAIKYNSISQIYGEKVDTPLRNTHEEFNEAMKKANATAYRRDLQRLCDRDFSHNTPFIALSYLNEAFNENCKLEDDFIPIYVEWRGLFAEVERRFGLDVTKTFKRSHYNYTQFKKDLLLKWTHMSADTAQRQINSTRKEMLVSTYDSTRGEPRFLQALHSLQRALHHSSVEWYGIGGGGGGPEEEKCFLKAAFMKYDFKTEPIYQLVSVVNQDLLRTQLYTGLCLNVSYSHNPERAQALNNTILQKVAAIANKIDLYVTKNLRGVWPEMTLSIAETEMKREGAEYDYASTAQRIRDQLNIRGEKRTFHNILLYRDNSFNTDEWFLADYCDNKTCLQLELHSGMSIFILRFKDDHFDQLTRSENAYTWLVNNGGKLNNLVYNHRNEWSLSSMFEYIKERLGGIGTLYKTMIVLRDAKLVGNCDIYYNVSFSAGVKGIRSGYNLPLFFQALPYTLEWSECFLLLFSLD